MYGVYDLYDVYDVETRHALSLRWYVEHLRFTPTS
jgi:hypothetical protein